MSYALTVTLSQILTVIETLAIAPPDAPAAAPAVSHTGFNVNKLLNANSTPAVTKMASFQKAMSGGTGTIDFTALPGTTGNVDASGKRIVAMLLSNPSAHAIAITTGASNGLPLFGSSTGKITLQPGASALIYDPSGTAQAVDGTHKTVDISGTGTDSLNVEIVLG